METVDSDFENLQQGLRVVEEEQQRDAHNFILFISSCFFTLQKKTMFKYHFKSTYLYLALTTSYLQLLQASKKEGSWAHQQPSKDEGCIQRGMSYVL